jgi:hypothetical protein
METLKCVEHSGLAKKQGRMALQSLIFSLSGTENPVTMFGQEGQVTPQEAPSGTDDTDAASLSNFPMLGPITMMDKFLSSVPWEYFLISVFTVLGTFFLERDK